MKLLNPIIDKLQELFPPNRVAIMLAGTITAISGLIAAWLAAHFPGLAFGQLEIAGVLTAALLISLRLLDRWFDRWQEGERVDYQGDVEAALTELTEAPEVSAFFEALPTFQGIAEMVAHVRARIDNGTINEAEVNDELATVLAVIDSFLTENVPAEEAPPEATQ